MDHAATSWPKSPAVMDAVTDMMHRGAAAGRGSHRLSQIADQCVTQCRRSLAKLIGASGADTIALTSGATQSLNFALRGLLRPGDHVVTTPVEHNAVLRTLVSMDGIDVSYAESDPDGRVLVDHVMRALGPDTRMVVITHASNVTGTVLPLREIAETVGRLPKPPILLCDAAQTIGMLPIDVGWGIDAVAAPGHKSIGGPLGTGFLYLAPPLHSRIIPSNHGGTGGNSDSLQMPDAYPAKMETGNLNVPGIAGLGAALQHWFDADAAARQQRRQALVGHLRDGCQRLKEHYPDHFRYWMGDALPMVSIALDGLAASDVVSILDAEFSICVRGGHHCAAKSARVIGAPVDGTVRISGGLDTSVDEMEACFSAIDAILQSIA
ncbi:MAG: aminotransferase class V-fold PLP-dependent enzyme [Planctomycetota bacterium]